MLLIFLGPPGSGKGTQSQRLAGNLGMVHLSTGELLRQAVHEGTELGKQAATYLDAGQLVPDELVVGVVCERLDDPDFSVGCLLDGFPRSIAQAETLGAYLAKRGSQVDSVIELQVDSGEVRQRMLERSRKEGRSDDTPETIAARFDVYESTTAPLVDYYQQHGLLRSVDGLGSPDEVAERIRAVIKRYDNE